MELKKYITKPIKQVEIKAIQVIDENKDLIEKTIGKKYLKCFMYGNDEGLYWTEKLHGHNKLGCRIMIDDDCYCLVRNTDFLIIFKDGSVSARTEHDFKNEFKKTK